MAKWTEQEDGKLLACIGDGLTAEETSPVVGKSSSACAGRASRLKVGFNSAPHAGLRAFLSAGGRIVREDLGGVVGVRWARASRSGGGFAAPICDRFVQLGILRAVDDGRAYAKAATL